MDLKEQKTRSAATIIQSNLLAWYFYRKFKRTTRGAHVLQNGNY
jgi:hypothetical protein